MRRVAQARGVRPRTSLSRETFSISSVTTSHPARQSSLAADSRIFERAPGHEESLSTTKRAAHERIRIERAHVITERARSHRHPCVDMTRRRECRASNREELVWQKSPRKPASLRLHARALRLCVRRATREFFRLHAFGSFVATIMSPSEKARIRRARFSTIASVPTGTPFGIVALIQAEVHQTPTSATSPKRSERRARAKSFSRRPSPANECAAPPRRDDHEKPARLRALRVRRHFIHGDTMRRARFFFSWATPATHPRSTSARVKRMCSQIAPDSP